MDGKKLLLEEQLDFLREMMSIGAGNANTALSQLLQCSVEMVIPEIHICTAPKVTEILDNPSLPVAGVRMEMVGNVRGRLFFVVPDKHKNDFIEIAEKAMFGKKKEGNHKDLSVLEEFGNILAGVYLTTIHDFCKLNIYHSVPTLAIDMIQSLLDESILDMACEAPTVIFIVNQFFIVEKNINTFFLIIPTMDSLKILLDSIKEAREIYGFKKD